MMRHGLKILIALGVIAYVLAVAAAAAHYTFPYQAVGQAIRDKFPNIGPLTFTFEGPEPDRPLAYSLNDISLDLNLPGVAASHLMDIDRIRAAINPLSLVKGNADVGFRIKAAGGESIGRAVYGLRGEHDLRIEMPELSLPEFVLDEPGGKGRIQGRLSGSLVILGQGQVVPTGGEGVIRLEQGKISNINVKELPLTELEFDSLVLEFKLDKGLMIVEKLDMQGQQGGFSLTGRVMNFQNPRLNMTGQAHMGPADNPLFSASFQISGPADRPRVKVTSTKGPNL